MSEVVERPSAITLRSAVSGDVPRILELLFAMHAETAPLPRSEFRMRGFVAHAMQRGVVLVTEQDGKVVSTAAMVGDSPWYSDAVQISDGWVYVSPEYRRTPHATTLLRAILDYTRRVNLPLHAAFMCRPDMADRIRAKGRLYERIFGRPVGMIFYVPAGG